MTAMTAAELRAALDRTAAAIDDPAKYIEVHRDYRQGWIDALRAVRDDPALLPESGVFVTEADLTRALRETGSYSRRPIDQWAAAILRELTR